MKSSNRSQLDSQLGQAGGCGAYEVALALQWAIAFANLEATPLVACRFLNRGKAELHPPIWVRRAVAGGAQVELALQWAADVFTDTCVGFANNVRTIDGGTHVDGLRCA